MIILLGMVSPKVQSFDLNCSMYTLFLSDISLEAMVYNITYKQMIMICTLSLNYHLIMTLKHSIAPWLTLNPVHWTLGHGCPPFSQTKWPQNRATSDWILIKCFVTMLPHSNRKWTSSPICISSEPLCHFWQWYDTDIGGCCYSGPCTGDIKTGVF